jgi:hypothetical protein
MKTKIFSFAFNRPDILQYQITSLQKFIVGEYDINIVYDTRDNQYYDQFKKICDDNDVSFHHHLSESGGTPSFYNAQAIKWIYDTVISKEDDCYVMLLDHDMFLIDELDIRKEMSVYDIIGCLQSREQVKYVWPGLCLFKKSSVEHIEFDFYPQTVDGQMLDTGGGTYKLLSDENIKFMDTGVDYPEEYKGIDLKDEKITGGYGYELHFDNKFLHFRNASNWHTQYQVGDGEKTGLLFQMLSDILDEKDKSYLELVIARYSENLDWVESYRKFSTVYNKGVEDIEGSIPLKNIGREAHTYLHHIVNNYDNLADYTCFLQGDPMDPHSPRFFRYLDHILNSNELLPEFFWISERIVEGDFEYKREPYHSVFPSIKYAYGKIFGEEPKLEKFIFGAGAQFCVSGNRIRKRPLEFYKNILDIFEYDPGEELDELSIKLLGNPGIQEDFHPINPELGLHMERFWGLIFNEV